MTAGLTDIGSVCAEGCCRAVVDAALDLATADDIGDVAIRPMYELIPLDDEGWGDAACWPDPQPWHDLDSEIRWAL